MAQRDFHHPFLCSVREAFRYRYQSFNVTGIETDNFHQVGWWDGEVKGVLVLAGEKADRGQAGSMRGVRTEVEWEIRSSHSH